MLYEELYQKITADISAGETHREYLQNLTNEFPYFSAAHFFLLKETTANDTDYKNYAGKTALHFNNPFFLKYQLTKKEQPAETIPLTSITGSILEVQPMPVEIRNIEELAAADVETTVNVSELEKSVQHDKTKELLFEPLHTTDYFASQGIKLSEEIQSADKLGKQLKSFTDWLKTMKKLQPGKLPEGDANIDIAVQTLAEKSNKGQEVLTESMAEVYLQQGKIAKAREIYEKLSLLNPAKSAYFAAKTELLKN